MSVTLYANWVHGTLASGTYTQASPEIPNAHTWTFAGDSSIATPGGSWGAQDVGSFPDDTDADYISTTVSSATMAATSGRVLLEVEGGYDGRYLFWAEATNWWDGRLRIQRSAGSNLTLTYEWQASTATLDLGTYPTGAFVVEVIYDAANGTAANRLRARTWALGGSAGSFSDTASSTSSGSSNQFVTLYLNDHTTNVPSSPMYIGRVIISDDISQDLSTYSEGGGVAIEAMIHHYRQQGIIH